MTFFVGGGTGTDIFVPCFGCCAGLACSEGSVVGTGNVRGPVEGCGVHRSDHRSMVKAAHPRQKKSSMELEKKKGGRMVERMVERMEERFVD